MKIPANITAHRSISACAGCDKSEHPKVVGWMRFEINAQSVMVIPGLDKPLTTFGCWTDMCLECIVADRVKVASLDHPQNYGYRSDWDAYRATGRGTEVPAIIAEMHAEWEATYGKSNA